MPPRPPLLLPRLLMLLLPALLCAGIHRSPLPQDQPDFTLDHTRIHLVATPWEHRLRSRSYLQGHMRRPGDHLDLVLLPGLRVDRVSDGHRPLPFEHRGEELTIWLGGVLDGGKRFRVIVDASGSFHDPERSAGPSRKPGATHAIAPHLDESGLVLPRESYWYPRPAWADPQDLELKLELPRNWRYSVRLFPSQEVRRGDRTRIHFLRSQGTVPRPIGLAAGPYDVEARRYGALEVRWLRFRRALAEHPTSEASWQRIDEVVASLERRLGPAASGRFDLVELSGGLLREGPTTFLGQGSFAWLENPTGEPNPRETLYLARELARAWFERSVRMPSWERSGLIHFLALLTIRELLGEAVFLDACRQAGRQYLDETGGAPFPGADLYPWEPQEWETPGQVPSLAAATGPAVLLLLSHLQRSGPERVDQALAHFAREYRGRRARLAELLELLDALPTRLQDPHASPR